MRRITFGLLVLTAVALGFPLISPSFTFADDWRVPNLYVLAGVCVVVWILTCVVGWRWPRAPRSVGLPLLVWLGWLLVSAELAPSSASRALGFVNQLLLGVALGWAVFDIARGPPMQQALGRSVALGASGVALLGLAEATGITGVANVLDNFRYQATFNVGEVPRISSTLPHPNIAAMILALAVPLQLAWAVTTRHVWTRIALGLGLAAQLIALVLTISRAGVFVAEVVLVGMALIALHKRQRLARVATAAAAVGLPVVLALVVARQPILLLHLANEGIQNWYRADYSTPARMEAHAGEASSVPVQLVNTGARTWLASGPNPFALSYHLKQLDGTPVTYDGQRTWLPADVPPGSSLELQAQLIAPQIPGAYLVEWDEVQEKVTWFSWSGTPVGQTYLMVAGQPDATRQAPAPEASPPPRVAAPPADRLTQWGAALRMAASRPLLGVGPDNFRWVYGDFAGLSAWDTGGHANSVYFEWLADTGVVGLGLFLWFAWRLLRRASNALLTTTSILRLALAASVAAWFLHGLFDYFYESPSTNLAFWLLAGLALAAAESGTGAACESPST